MQEDHAMPRPNYRSIADLPEKITIHTFPELQKWAEHAKAKKFKCLIFVGGPGLGKTFTLRTELDDDLAWIKGRITPVKLYGKLFQRKDRGLVVLNDTRSLLADRFGEELLLAACETDEGGSRVTWDTAKRKTPVEVIKPDGTREIVTPDDSFHCDSFIVIITNDLGMFRGSLEAILDRAVVVYLDFSVDEVHRAARQWFPYEGGKT
jgi:hypothetical protein